MRQRTTTDGRFTYREAGDADAPAIVFLHGIGLSSEGFAPQLEAFSADHHAIAWDMPGYGGSAPIEPEGIDGYAHAFADFTRALDLERPVLVGHSIGGMIVQAVLALGLLAPRAVVLAQTSAAFGGKDPRWAEDFVRSRLEPLERGETMASLAARSAAALVGEDADPAARPLAERVIASSPVDAYRASTRAMIGFDQREALSRIACPTLLVAGSRDANAPAATMAKMAERIPGAAFVCFEGCGHLVMLERPRAFNDAVRDFLVTKETAA